MNNEVIDTSHYLTDEAKKLLKFASQKDNLLLNEIAGKPKNMIVEIIKRYFKNPYVVIATIVFISVIITSVVVLSTSEYNRPDKIAEWGSSFKVNNSVIARDLPSQYAPYVTRIFPGDDKEFYRFLYGFHQLPEFNKYLNFHYTLDAAGNLSGDLQYTPDKAKFIARFNAYEFFKLREIISIAINEGKINGFNELIDYQGVPATKTLDAAWIDQTYKTITDVNSILGTDAIGQDIWTRTWAGTWESIQLALIVATIETIIGVAIGAWLGFNAGKKVDTIVMRILEIITAPPALIWFIMLVSIMGTSNLSLAVALIVVGWTGPVGGTRMFIITVKDEEYILASKSLGATQARQIFAHALPAVIGKISYSYVNRIPSVIMSVSSLAFLGFFNDDNSSNLGKLLIDANKYVDTNAWILILPIIILMAISLSLHFIALGVHDALDPKVIRVK